MKKQWERENTEASFGSKSGIKEEDKLWPKHEVMSSCPGEAAGGGTGKGKRRGHRGRHSGAAEKGNATVRKQPGVLVVESHKAYRNLVALLLDRAGYHVAAVDNGNDAIEWVFTQPDAFDLILLNIRLPDMSGLEVCRSIRSLPEAHHVPILAFSADETAAEQAAIQRCGINDFLTPFAKASTIRAILRKWLEQGKEWKKIVKNGK